MDRALCRLTQFASWSGGGGVVDRNLSEFASRFPDLLTTDGEAVAALVTKNAISRQELGGRFVYMPQNAWPWIGPWPQEARWRAKLLALRAVSEVAIRRASGLIRLSESIPSRRIGRSVVLANVLDQAFDTESKDVTIDRDLDLSPPFVLLAGSLTEYRQVEPVLSGLHLVSDSRLRLIVVGEELSRQVGAEVRAQASSSGGRICFVPGRMNRSQLLSIARKAEAAVLPSAAEASPIFAAECAALGIPCLATSIPGHEQFLDRCGLSRFFDGPQFAQAMDEGDFGVARDRRVVSSTGRSEMREEWYGSLAVYLREQLLA